jgi:metal-responsive CopG/Arc/MetJ family transcriptional regulator
MVETKSFGIRIEKNVVDRVDEICEKLKDLNASRSEVIEVILKSFFNTKINHEQVLRSLITKNRLEKRS